MKIGRRGWLAAMVAMLVCEGATAGIGAATPAGFNAMLQPPASEGKPIDVAVGLHIINISSIDEVSESFQIDAYLLERWKDPRLAFTPSSAADRERRYQVDEIWVPKVEMVNAASPRDRYDTVAVVSPDGTVNYAERCKAVLSTKFQLRRFPFDTQQLAIIMHPFISSSHLVSFSLNDHKTWMSSELDTYSSLAQWRLETVRPELGQARMYDGSESPEIRFMIQVERRSHFYVWKVFLPLILMVFLSWAVFWIEPIDLTNQVTVAVTTILTVIAFAFAISATMPRVPYLTYIDAFFLQCYIFVFLAIVELMSVHVTHRSERRRDVGLRIRAISRWGVPAAFVACNLILAIHFLT
jgi:Neurotransmitter-gated ion-channel ligand binding domain/Neurotransmitter-gated ion-channel transmembrane region